MTLKNELHLGLNFVLFFFTLSIAISGHSTVNNSGYWIGVLPQYSLDENQSLLLQAELRHIGEDSFALFRPFYHYQTSDSWTFGVGYDLFTTKDTEQRPWLEAIYKENSLTLRQNFLFRLRQETRWISNNSKTAYRSRLMVWSQFTLSNTYKIDAIVWDEFFFSQKTFSGTNNEFDRNWIGARVRLYPKEKFFYDIGCFLESVNNRQNSNGLVALASAGGRF